MVTGRSRVGVFLLMMAAAALCLGLLITTPSDAQTRAESQNARAVAGDDDCIAFEDEDVAAEDGADEDAQDEDTQNEDTQSDAADTEDADAEDAAGLSTEDADGNGDAEDDDEGDTTDGRASQDGGITGQQTQDEDNVANQRVQSQNESSLQVRNDNTGVFQQSLQTEESGDVQQALEAGEEDGSGLSTQDEDDDNDNQALQNGDEDDGDTGDTGESEQQTQDENGEDENGEVENGDEEDECVIAETVPDEPLLPTGAPAKSGSNETAKDKSGGEKQSKSGGKKQAGTKVKTESKTEGKTGGKQADGAGKRSSGGKKLEVQDRGKKIEVEDRSGKTPRQEKSGSRARSASSNDARPEKARSGSSSAETPRAENPRSESARSESTRAESNRPDPGRVESYRAAGSARDPDLAPRVAAAEWAAPSREEVDFTEGPRRFAPDPGAEMTLSVRALRLYGVPIANSNRLEELDRGLVRMPGTSLPWDDGDQKNVFVAGHYLGLPDTQSRMIFYNLDKLKSGDELVLKDSLGQTYKYRVSEKFAAGPEDSWVMGQVQGRDMLTLQTCIPPDFGKRLIVRADRVE